MQKVLVTGATGMLGSKVANYIFNDPNFKAFGTGRSDVQSLFTYIKADLLNKSELNNLLTSVYPDIIVHCAANVNLTDCETNKTEAYKINVEVSKQLASFNPGVCKIVYISTDSVFDGWRESFSETDTPAPLNYYAQSKLEGENAVIKANKNSLVLRTNMYGFNSSKEGNSIFEWLYKNLSADNNVSGFTDIHFNPLYTLQLAEIIIRLINKNAKGILHLGCIEKISKYQFALLIAEAFGFDKSLIKADVSNVMPSTLKRPKNTTLNTTELYKLTEKKYSIADGIDQLKSDFIQQKKLHE